MKPHYYFTYDPHRGDFVERALCREDPQTIWQSRRKQRARTALREWWREFKWQLAYALICVALFGGLYLIAVASYGG